MITVEARADERQKTLEQFEQLGLDVVVLVDQGDRPSCDNNRRNAERAVKLALEAECDLLLVEDDIDLAPDFVPALAAARRTGEVTTFWLEKAVNHPPAYRRLIDEGGLAPVGLHLVADMQTFWYGTQAIFIPFEVVRTLVDRPFFGVPNGLPFDRWLREQVWRILVALPNPVQHRNAPTLVEERRVRISPTYHLPRVGRWEEATWPN